MTALDELRKITARVTHMNAEDLNPDTELKSIKADSLHWVQIIISAETTFNIEIDVEKMKELKTFGDFVNYVDGLIKQKA